MSIKIICFVLLLFTNLAFAEGKFIVLPLPFYSGDTGVGMTLKMMHTDFGGTTFLDLTAYGTEQKQYGLMTTLGQKKSFLSDALFWELGLVLRDSEVISYGEGNHVSTDHEFTYDMSTRNISPKLGINLTDWLKVFGKYSFRRQKIINVQDPDGFFYEYTSQITHNQYSLKGFGGGVDLKIVDDEVKTKRGVHLMYEFMEFGDTPYANVIKYHSQLASAAFYIPLGSGFSHAVRFYYQSNSSGSKFYMNPEIKVRGIEDGRHNDNTSVAIQNEFRIYSGGNWITVPFFDLGRVLEYDESSTHLDSDLHYGYGMGIRYILKEALIIRADLGFSKNGESSFEFSYLHTY